MNDSYIFISKPKSASKSIHEIIGNNKYHHMTASDIKKIIGTEYSKKISFCVFRNPIDLVKSWYYFHKFPQTDTKFSSIFAPALPDFSG